MEFVSESVVEDGAEETEEAIDAVPSERLGLRLVCLCAVLILRFVGPP